MNFHPTELPDVILIEPDVHRDRRGFFLESYHRRKYADGGLTPTFVQDNHSSSTRGTLRGLHGQRQQGKLVRVIAGEIFDVAVDVRRGSPTFARWVGAHLSAENFLQVYIPPGFVHGFCVLSEIAQVEYKVTEFYDAAGEFGILWNDVQLGINWPIEDPLLSDKDRAAPTLAEIMDQLPTYEVRPA